MKVSEEILTEEVEGTSLQRIEGYVKWYHCVSGTAHKYQQPSG